MRANRKQRWFQWDRQLLAMAVVCLSFLFVFFFDNFFFSLLHLFLFIAARFILSTRTCSAFCCFFLPSFYRVSPVSVCCVLLLLPRRCWAKSRQPIESESRLVSFYRVYWVFCFFGRVLRPWALSFLFFFVRRVVRVLFVVSWAFTEFYRVFFFCDEVARCRAVSFGLFLFLSYLSFVGFRFEMVPSSSSACYRRHPPCYLVFFFYLVSTWPALCGPYSIFT